MSELFDSNTPAFFAPHERPEFERYLQNPGEYLVLEDAGQVVACGDIWQGDGHAELVWGMVARGQQRRGLGSTLLLTRLARLRGLGAAEVRLDTTQHSAPFCARHGFQEVRQVPDGYGPGLNRIAMIALLE